MNLIASVRKNSKVQYADGSTSDVGPVSLKAWKESDVYTYLLSDGSMKVVFNNELSSLPRMPALAVGNAAALLEKLEKHLVDNGVDPSSTIKVYIDFDF